MHQEPRQVQQLQGLGLAGDRQSVQQLGQHWQQEHLVPQVQTRAAAMIIEITEAVTPSMYLPLASADVGQEAHQGPDQAALDIQDGEEMVAVDIQLTCILASAGRQGAG